MFRVRPGLSLLPMTMMPMTIALAALLMAGCSGDGEESADPAPGTASATPTATAEPMNLSSEQLEQAGEQAGAEGFGAVLCESVQGAVQGGQATGEALGPVLDSIITGAGRSSDSVKDADIDATMTQQCPQVRTDALEAAGVKSLEELLTAA